MKKLFRREFAGTLVSDFWGAYNAFAGSAAQKCLTHLLRELKHTTKYKSPDKNWPAFQKKLKRLIRDAIRLRKAQGDLTEAAFVSRRARIHQRLQAIVDSDWQDKNARRLIKQGGVKIDGEKVSDVNAELSPGGTSLLQVGKRRFKKITLLGD